LDADLTVLSDSDLTLLSDATLTSFIWWHLCWNAELTGLCWSWNTTLFRLTL